MNEVNAVPITKIGVYEIKGSVINIGSHCGKKISVNLNYNETYKYFFMVKNFLSGKYHIDYFYSVIDEDFFSIENGQGNLRIGYAELPMGSRFLHYNFDTKTYTIVSRDENNIYEMEIKAFL
jgi:hypothetical protein